MGEKTKYVVLAVLCAVLLILVAVILSAAPADEKTEPETERTVVTLVYAYQNTKWSACVEEVIRRFEEKHPDIDIQYKVRYEDNVYEATLYKLAARDELGDIMQIKEPYVWAESGLIAALPASLTDRVSTTCTVEDRVYGVCALGTTTGIVYNKAIFDQLGLSVPKTYEDFLRICGVLKEYGITPLGFGGEDLWHFEYWLNHFLRTDVLSQQPDFLARCSAGERNWNDPLITEILTHDNELFALGYVDERWPSTADGALAVHLADGRFAMAFSGPWLASAALSMEPELDLGWFYVPNTDGETVAGDSLDVFWTVSADCAEDEARYAAAVTFLEFFYTEGIYEDVYTAVAGFSTLTDPQRAKAPAEGVMEETNQAHREADQCIRGYVGDENTPPGFEKKLLTLLSRMCAGELTVEETQALAAQYWEDCLRQEVSYAH